MIKEESMVDLFGAAKTEEFLRAMTEDAKEDASLRLKEYRRWLRDQGRSRGLVRF
jgi:hypothetical protein